MTDIIRNTQNTAIDLLPSNPLEWDYKDMKAVAEIIASETTTYFDSYKKSLDYLNEVYYKETLKVKRCK